MQKVILMIILHAFQALFCLAHAQSCKPLWPKQSPYLKKQYDNNQFVKGRILMGASYSFDRLDREYYWAPESYRARVASLWAVKVGYFVKNKLAIGIQASYKVLPYLTKDGRGALGYESYGAGFFVKRYLKIATCVFLSIESDIFASRTVTTFKGAKKMVFLESPLRIAGATLSPGLVFQPSSRVGIEIKYGNFIYTYSQIYNVNDLDIPELGKSFAAFFLSKSGFGFNYGLENIQTWSFSINYYFLKQPKKMFVKYPQDR